MIVTNNTDSPLAIQGVSIPPGQGRNVRGFDADLESNAVRLEAGDISVPGADVDLTVAEDVGEALEAEDRSKWPKFL